MANNVQQFGRNGERAGSGEKTHGQETVRAARLRVLIEATNLVETSWDAVDPASHLAAAATGAQVGVAEAVGPVEAEPASAQPAYQPQEGEFYPVATTGPADTSIGSAEEAARLAYIADLSANASELAPPAAQYASGAQPQAPPLEQIAV